MHELCCSTSHSFHATPTARYNTAALLHVVMCPSHRMLRSRPVPSPLSLTILSRARRRSRTGWCPPRSRRRSICLPRGRSQIDVWRGTTIDRTTSVSVWCTRQSWSRPGGGERGREGGIPARLKVQHVYIMQACISYGITYRGIMVDRTTSILAYAQDNHCHGQDGGRGGGGDPSEVEGSARVHAGMQASRHPHHAVYHIPLQQSGILVLLLHSRSTAKCV